MPNSEPFTAPALSCERISKRFGSHTALHNASLTIRAGSVHALVGENGAGKSTLMNIVSGLLQPDAGTLNVFGSPAAFRSPRDAVHAGIGMVHQHFLLAEALSVAENIALGLRESAGGLFFNRAKAEAAVEKLAAETGLHVDPRARVSTLPVGLRQRVEILKALSRGARILLLDEPTAVLAPPEVETLFSTLRKLREAGRTIAIITHKLDEVYALASDATVLRRGETVFAGSLSQIAPPDLAEKMIGRGVPSVPIEPPVLKDETVLNLPGLTLRAGEIVGVAGVEGNGQQALIDSILHAADTSTLAVIPADRQREGLVLDFSLTENLHLRDTPQTRSAGFAWVPWTRLRAEAVNPLRAFDVQPPDPDLPAAALSGGNQQKVIAARELSRNPRIILACNPARGLDVGAAAEIHRRLLDAARKLGSGVILISSDLDEVLHLSDRVYVLYRGALREIGPRGVSKDETGRAMVGLAKGDAA